MLVLYQRVTKWLYFKYLLTVNGLPSLFRIDSAHQIVTSLPHALWVY
jgi:hypothetical protein